VLGGETGLGTSTGSQRFPDLNPKGRRKKKQMEEGNWKPKVGGARVRGILGPPGRLVEWEKKRGQMDQESTKTPERERKYIYVEPKSQLKKNHRTGGEKKKFLYEKQERKKGEQT